MLRTTSRYRRVTNELKNYNEKNNTFFLIENNIIANPVQTLDIKYTTFGKFFNDDRLAIIKLEYPDTYPFSKPNITINRHEYISLLYMDGNWMKKFNIDMCLCCNSILCKWNVTHDMLSILKEIEKNLKIKSRLLDIISTRSVIRQKIGFYVPIETYL